RDHPHRDAGAAQIAGRTIGNRLTAAKTAMGKKIVELVRLLANEMCEHLALLAPFQIGARRGSRQVKLRRIARVLCHVRAVTSRRMELCSGGFVAATSIAPGLPSVNTSPVLLWFLIGGACNRSVDQHSAQHEVMQKLLAPVE